MMRVSRDSLLDLIVRSRSSQRKRDVLVLHPPEKIGTRCMLNCIQPDSYIQPHMHPKENGQEIWVFLQGQVGVIIFTPQGEPQQKLILSSIRDNLIEIPCRTYHMAIALERDSVMYEFTEGPYDSANYKTFAPWAPGEEDREKAASCLQKYRKILITG